MLRIFPKYYYRRLYGVSDLEEIVEILLPWTSWVLKMDHRFLMRVAGFGLGDLSKPAWQKRIWVKELLRVNDFEDLQQSLLEAIVVTYHKFDLDKAHATVREWLAWRLAPEFAKLVSPLERKPVEPFDLYYEDPLLAEFEGKALRRGCDMLVEK